MDQISKIEQEAITFGQNVGNLERLLELDELITGATLDILKDRQGSLERIGIDNAQLIGENAIKNLENIRENKSLKTSYSLVYNQCAVLLVSYFSSAIHSIFNASLATLLTRDVPKRIGAKEIKITLAELKEHQFRLDESIGEIMSKKLDISFQDMQSISRSFRDFFSVDISWDKRVNNIIATQACRNAIVHSGEIVDERLLNQLRNSSDRDIQKSLELGQKILFSPDEVRLAGSEMKSYLAELCSELEAAIGAT